MSVASPSTQIQDAYLAQATANGHVWIHSPATAEVYMDICNLCHQRRPYEPGEMESEGHAGPGISLAGPRMLALSLTEHYCKRSDLLPAREVGPTLHYRLG